VFERCAVVLEVVLVSAWWGSPSPRKASSRWLGVATRAGRFSARVDRASYVIPTIAVVAAAGIAGAVVAMAAGVAAVRRGGGPPSGAQVIGWSILVGVVAGAWWIRRLWRIHHERKLVIDDDGIFYVAFAGRPRVMRWDGISAITEEDERGRQGWRSLIVHHTGGKLTIRERDFHGYREIRRLASAHLAGRTVLLER
jgi:hypothetical protein